MVTMKSIKFCVESCSLVEFISYWIQVYNDGKYPETVYEENLKKRGILEENKKIGFPLDIFLTMITIISVILSD